MQISSRNIFGFLHVSSVSRSLCRPRDFSGFSKAKDFLNIEQLQDDELAYLIDESIRIKGDFKNNPKLARQARPLEGTTMSMIFQKRSTRTRVSTETGLFLLGGHSLMLGPQDVQLGVNETLKDTAKVLCRFNDIILARVFSNQDVLELAKESSVPVINALSDKYHPLQTLADLMTLKEHFGTLKGLTLAWVGDGNNVLHDLAIGSLKSDMNVQIATPKGYEPDSNVMNVAKNIADTKGVRLNSSHDPKTAVAGADVVVTDTWVSMGQESDAKKKKLDFAGYQVSAELMSLAKPSAVFLHCLPRKPEEVTDEIFYSEKSLVFPEAENRMWTVMAVSLHLLGQRWKI